MDAILAITALIVSLWTIFKIVSLNEKIRELEEILYEIDQKIDGLKVETSEPLPTQVTLPNKVSLPEKNETSSAWKNEKNIPIGPNRSTPTGSATPPVNEPLSRPAGFYR